MNGLFNNKKACSSCAACENVCTKDAISMQLDNYGFLRPFIDESKCVKCGLCEKKCPWVKQIHSPNCNFEMPVTYAAFAKDSIIRKDSSSGGIFSILATEILKQKGAVVGVAQQDVTSFKYTIIRNENELKLLRGSKYVQAIPGLIYRKTKELLQENIKVLFSGTPCQIAALYSLLGERHYENLWTIDIVCHGTPSFKVFQKYIQEIELEKQGSIKKTFFRDKRLGWKQYSMTNVIEYCDGNSFQHSHTLQEDIFLKTFLSNICLNESCYNCNYNGIPRLADITIGDYWGVERFHPDMNDDKGISLLMINNNRGKFLLERVKANITIQESELNKAIVYNPCILKSYPVHPNRDEYFKDLKNHSLRELFNKYV